MISDVLSNIVCYPVYNVVHNMDFNVVYYMVSDVVCQCSVLHWMYTLVNT